MSNYQLQGLYAITSADTPDLLNAVELALRGGAQLLQYRDKSQDDITRHQMATALKQCCDRYQVPLLINDDIELAASISAAGVHLGQDDRTLSEARLRLGSNAIIGISCYNQLDLALAAARNGASYVAFGRLFPSTTKPDAKPARLALITAAKAQLDIPVVAIGGITPENAQPVVAAGADMLAVIDGLFGQTDIRATAAHFSQFFG